MARAFEAATGLSVMRYVRARRLSEAARRLADGAPDILDARHRRRLRLSRGIHARVSRAIRTHARSIARAWPSRQSCARGADQNGRNPSPPTSSHRVSKTASRFSSAWLSERYTCDTSTAIPSQWQRFGAYFGKVPGQVSGVAYGVCYNADDAGNFDYLCGVEVSDFSALPPELSRVRIAAQRYAVFSHREHISAIRRTLNTIWNQGLLGSGHVPADAPNFNGYPSSSIR